MMAIIKIRRKFFKNCSSVWKIKERLKAMGAFADKPHSRCTNTVVTTENLSYPSIC